MRNDILQQLKFWTRMILEYVVPYAATFTLTFLIWTSYFNDWTATVDLNYYGEGFFELFFFTLSSLYLIQHIVFGIEEVKK